MLLEDTKRDEFIRNNHTKTVSIIKYMTKSIAVLTKPVAEPTPAKNGPNAKDNSSDLVQFSLNCLFYISATVENDEDIISNDFCDAFLLNNDCFLYLNEQVCSGKATENMLGILV